MQQPAQVRSEGPKKPSRRRSSLLIPVPILGALVAYGALRPASEKTAAGERAPSFSLPLLNVGGRLSSGDFEGSPVVVNFFASWCDPCRKEAGVLVAARRRYKHQGVRFLGVDVRDSVSSAEQFVNKYGITYPVVSDKGETFAKKLGVYGLPETFFITSQGKLLLVEQGQEKEARQGTVVLGAITPSTLRNRIEALLKATKEES